MMLLIDLALILCAVGLYLAWDRRTLTNYRRWLAVHRKRLERNQRRAARERAANRAVAGNGSPRRRPARAAVRTADPVAG